MLPSAKIDLLHSGLLAMYEAEGVSLEYVTPEPRQSFEDFRASALGVTRRASRGERPVLAVTRSKAVVHRVTKQTGTRCGLVLFSPPGEVIGLGYIDKCRSIASARTHLHKYVLTDDDDSDPDTCVACQVARKDVQCDACFTSLCNSCFVKTAVLKPGPLDTHTCPGCRAQTPLAEVVAGITYTDSPRTGTYNAAILDAMRELGVTQSCLTILEDRSHGDRLSSRMIVSTGTKYKNLQKHTQHPRAVKNLLKRLGTVFLVGFAPFTCDDCDKLHEADLQTGRAFVVTRNGIVEAPRMFAPFSLLAMAIFQDDDEAE
jgi:hypothetical protein